MKIVKGGFRGIGLGSPVNCRHRFPGRVPHRMADLRTTEIIWNASLISGMMLFLKTYGQDSDDASFSQRMEAIDPQEIVRRSKTVFSTNSNAKKADQSIWRSATDTTVCCLYEGVQ